LRIYDAAGNAITALIDSTASGETTTQNFTAGHWYSIAVSGFHLAIGNYTLKVNGPSLPRPSIATPVPTFSGSANGSLDYGADLDYWQVTAPDTASTLNLTVAPVAGLDTFIEIYDSTGNFLRSFDNAGSGGADTLNNYPVTGGATYFIGVSSGYRSHTGNYVVTADFNPDHVPPAPDLVSVSGIPSAPIPGQPFLVTIKAKCISGVGGQFSAINASVRYGDGSDDVIIGSVGASWADAIYNYPPGTTIYGNDCNPFPSVDHLIEAVDNAWAAGEEHILTFSITPLKPGSLQIRARVTFHDGDSGCTYINNASVSGGVAAVDQQHWQVAQFVTTVAQPNGLTIVPRFDASIANHPKAAAIMATINSAIATYQAAFRDPLVVSITFKTMGSGLGRSTTQQSTIPYADYRAALAAHATNPDDATALAHLPSTTGNPVNGHSQMVLDTALARALGFNATPQMGLPDGIIELNIDLTNVSSSETDQQRYSLLAVVCHEIDEVLGTGSALDNSKNGDPSPSGSVTPEDLFRYTDEAGVRSFSTSSSARAYFSLDGKSLLARFNQTEGGDFGDWYSSGGQTPQVQDAFSTPGVTPTLGIELRVLDALGYNRVVPTFTINSSAGSGGAIDPPGNITVKLGADQVYNAIPSSADYVIDGWYLDGTRVKSGGSQYKLESIQAPHAVRVTFVFAPTKADQTITFAPIANKSYGDGPFMLNANASSGLTVDLRVVSGPAALSGNELTITAAGVVVVRASQGGNASYNAAPDADRTFAIAKADQVISIGPLPNRSVSEPAFALSASANSGLPVSFSLISGPGTLAGNTIQTTGIGEIRIRAFQPGNENYNSSEKVGAFGIYPAPTLRLVQQADQITLSWPKDVPGYLVESRSLLQAGGAWLEVNEGPIVVENEFRLTLKISLNPTFYRLKKN